MQVDGYIQALKDDLNGVAQLGDENVARAAQLLSMALESSFGRRLLEALNEAALELTTQLEDARVEVRLSGNEPQLVVVEEQGEPTAGPADEAFTARITLRRPGGRHARRLAPRARRPRPPRPADGRVSEGGHVIQRTFETPGELRLDLRLPSGRIDVETYDGTQTEVELLADREDALEHAVV